MKVLYFFFHCGIKSTQQMTILINDNFILRENKNFYDQKFDFVIAFLSIWF